MRNLSGVLLVLALTCSGPRASGAQAPARGWLVLLPGLEYRELGKTDAPSTWMYQVRFSPNRYRLGVLANTSATEQPHSRQVADWLARSQAVVAINGGYFGTQEEPLGYLRDRQRVWVGDIATGAAFTGVFWMQGNRSGVSARADFTPADQDFAIQAGPRLVAGGRAVQGFRAHSPRRRTGIAVDRQGRVVLYATGVAGMLTFEQLQDMLLGPEARGGIDPLGVLNLDGGSSTGMAIQTPRRRLTLPSFTGVPVALGVFSRQ